MTYDLEAVKKWLATVTHSPMPATVDSCAVSCVVDVLRVARCFALSARYALCLGIRSSRIHDGVVVPDERHFDRVAQAFEDKLSTMIQSTP